MYPFEAVQRGVKTERKKGGVRTMLMDRDTFNQLVQWGVSGVGWTRISKILRDHVVGHFWRKNIAYLEYKKDELQRHQRQREEKERQEKKGLHAFFKPIQGSSRPSKGARRCCTLLHSHPDVVDAPS
jgi:hypothetical protein